MQAAEGLSLEQIRAFLAASDEVGFEGRNQAEVYGWVNQTLCQQRYQELKRGGRGLVRRYLEKMTGLSRAQVTRLITQFLRGEEVKPRPYRRYRFPRRYTREDVATLVNVDEAHQTLSGPATQKLLQRAYYDFRIYFTKKKNPEVNLTRVHVPAKIIVLRNDDIDEDGLIADISRYANSQNSVKLSDLSANKPFHVQIEQLALSTYCPDGIGRWFYERAAGSYNTMLAREGTTPARLRHRKITKTDLAKFLNARAEKPDAVSFGSQKNFERFMAELVQDNPPLPDVPWYKQMAAKAIIFKRATSLVRPRFQAFQANITTYVVSLVANRLGPELDLDKIWQRQDLSPELKQQITEWAGEVNHVLHQTAAGKMVSEWAKKPECREAVRTATYSDPLEGIPERRLGQLV